MLSPSMFIKEISISLSTSKSQIETNKVIKHRESLKKNMENKGKNLTNF